MSQAVALRFPETRSLADKKQIEMLTDRLRQEQLQFAAKAAEAELLRHEQQTSNDELSAFQRAHAFLKQEFATMKMEQAAARTEPQGGWEEEASALKAEVLRLEGGSEAIAEADSLRSANAGLRRTMTRSVQESLESRTAAFRARAVQMNSTRQLTRVEGELMQCREEVLRERRALQEAEASSQMMHDLYETSMWEWQEWQDTGENGEAERSNANDFIQTMRAHEKALRDISWLRQETNDNRVALSSFEGEICGLRRQQESAEKALARSRQESIECASLAEELCQARLSGVLELQSHANALLKDTPEVEALCEALRSQVDAAEFQRSQSQKQLDQSVRGVGQQASGQGSSVDAVQYAAASDSLMASHRRPRRVAPAPRTRPLRRARPVKEASPVTEGAIAEDNVAKSGDESGIDLSIGMD